MPQEQKLKRKQTTGIDTVTSQVQQERATAMRIAQDPFSSQEGTENFLQRRMQLDVTPEEEELFRRRYTEVEILTNRHQRMVLERELQPAVQTAQSARELGMSKSERKEAQKTRKKVQQREIEEAKQRATQNSNFVHEDILKNSIFQEKVLQKKTSVKADGEDLTQAQLMMRVADGDYANLEQLDPVLRNICAQRYMDSLSVSLPEGADLTPQTFVDALMKQGGVAQLMNPLFRTAVSVSMKEGRPMRGLLGMVDHAFFAQVEDLCNQRVMSATMYAQPTDGTPEELTANRNTQIMIAKTMLAAHLGRMQQVDTVNGQKQSRDWSKGVATAFAHCSRVSFTLPGDEKTLESMTGKRGKKGEEGVTFFKRRAATHSLSRKSKDGAKQQIEKKTWGTLHDQWGSNVAIGGMGNDGQPTGEYKPGDTEHVLLHGTRKVLTKISRKLKNDGSCGHIYMHAHVGDKEKYTGLMIGFESDEDGQINQTGHKHDWHARPEFMSSFGGMRTDEIGDKYGGRVCDLSGLAPEGFEELMQRLEEKMTRLMDSTSPADKAQLINICDRLSGNLMGTEEILQLLGDEDGPYQIKTILHLSFFSGGHIDPKLAGKVRTDRKAGALFEELSGGYGPEEDQRVVRPGAEELHARLRQKYCSETSEYRSDTDDMFLQTLPMPGETERVFIRGLGRGRLLGSLEGSLGQERSEEQLDAMYEKLSMPMRKDIDVNDADEVARANAAFLEGIRELKRLYLNQYRRLEATYGTLLARMHPEDIIRQLGPEFFDQYKGNQDVGQIIDARSRLVFDPENNAEDRELQRYYNCFFNATTLVHHYGGAVSMIERESLHFNDFKGSAENFHARIVTEGIGGPSMSDEEEKKYLEDLRARAAREGWSNRLYGHFKGEK
ncbi:MAG: hypothetical protein IK016_03060 [Lachnospiraceae bacterium]|nr:hypothetical protein [Lachnospiraceae bacterium]